MIGEFHSLKSRRLLTKSGTNGINRIVAYYHYHQRLLLYMKIGNYEVLFHRGKGLWSVTGKDGYVNHFPISLSKITSPAGQKAWRFLIWEFCVEWIDKNQPETAPSFLSKIIKRLMGFTLKSGTAKSLKGGNLQSSGFSL